MFVLAFLLLCYFRPSWGIAGTSNYNNNIECIAKERVALLQFKQGIEADACGLLSSWGDEQDKKDCCKWNGIQCNNRTGHIIELDLHGPQPCLSGNVGPSLLELKHLNYLDLSYNNFSGQPIPSFIGSLTKLKYLNLSWNDFSGEIPHQLGNLSSLVSLDLNSQSLHVENLWWLSRLTVLRHLDLSGANLSKASVDWFHVINKISSLTVLRMDWCGLSPLIPSSLPFINSTRSLRSLSLSGNHFDSSVFQWLFSLSGIYTHLVYVDLSVNQPKGPIPDEFSNLKYLAHLDLSHNNIQGRLPVNLGNLCSLQELDLSANNLTEELASVVETLSGCAHTELQSLDLGWNALWGSLSGIDVFNRFPSLRKLDLSSNKLDGTISEDIRQLSMLESLHLDSNSLEGEVSYRHFAGFSRLKDLSLSGLVLNFSDDWIPPFQLHTTYLSSCVLGPRFPKWLLTQTNISYLDISNSRISDTIPMSFWTLLQPNLIYLNLSHNKISGTFPEKPITFAFLPLIDLSSNKFEGAAPVFRGNVGSLILANNMFQNPIPLLCPMAYRRYPSVIDLSNNLLSGELPNDCWTFMGQLKFLNLTNNKLSGRLPSFDGLKELESLHLSHNRFSGELPSSLKYCSSLGVLELGYNSLSGYISPELENNFPPSLIVLSLRSNKFLGSMPQSLCQLPSLQILDLSFNNLSGTIPKCINSLVGMTEMHRREA